jgi:hypothetical protein
LLATKIIRKAQRNFLFRLLGESKGAKGSFHNPYDSIDERMENVGKLGRKISLVPQS